MLHLCGFDHGESAAAQEMGALEREILAEFGIALDAESAAAGNSATAPAMESTPAPAR